MNRRSLLKAIGSSTVLVCSTGCVSDLLAANSGYQTTIVHHPGFSEDAPIDVETTLVRDRLDEDSYPRIEMEYLNPTEEPVSIADGFDGAAEVGTNIPIRSDSRELILASDRLFIEEEPGDPEDNCQQMSWSWGGTVGTVSTIGPGSSSQFELGLIGNRSTLDGSCPDPGEHTFLHGVGILGDDPADDIDMMSEMVVELE